MDRNISFHVSILNLSFMRSVSDAVCRKSLSTTTPCNLLVNSASNSQALRSTTQSWNSVRQLAVKKHILMRYCRCYPAETILSESSLLFRPQLCPPSVVSIKTKGQRCCSLRTEDERKGFFFPQVQQIQIETNSPSKMSTRLNIYFKLNQCK